MMDKNQWSQEKQRQEVLDSFSIIEPDIILCKRVLSPTPYQVNQNIKITQELTTKNNCHYYINDARESIRPEASVRKAIRDRLNHLNGYIKHLIVILKDDFQFEIAVQFIFQTLELDYKVSVVKSLEEAMKIIKDDRENSPQ